MFLFLKRFSDIILSLIMLIVMSPIFLGIAIAIKLDDGGPTFYRQERVGRDGRLFYIYKFRTMVVDAEKIGSGFIVTEDDPRITRIGRILRYTSLDELPQLINILKGEMSFVGPRPTLRYQVEKYNDRQRQRLSVKPGVTGWAQVNGRNVISWPERIEYDLWYVDNLSLFLDVKIFFKTFVVILKKQDLYRQDGSTDPISRIDAGNDSTDKQ